MQGIASHQEIARNIFRFLLENDCGREDLFQRKADLYAAAGKDCKPATECQSTEGEEEEENEEEECEHALLGFSQ
eukprot:15450208-Alexandrium_andersonii.AAC.1